MALILEAYSLLREILADEELNQYVLNITGKMLASIDAGPQVTSPAVAITFNGGDITRAENTMQGIDYTVTFDLPFWGSDAMEKCHAFLDVVIDAFFAHERRVESGRRSFVTTLRPFVVEPDPEKELWQVSMRVTVAVFR